MCMTDPFMLIRSYVQRSLTSSCMVLWSRQLIVMCVYSSRDVPALVQGQLSGLKVVSIAAGESHSAAITDKGALYTWGRGNYGRLGHGMYVGFLIMANLLVSFCQA